MEINSTAQIQYRTNHPVLYNFMGRPYGPSSVGPEMLVLKLAQLHVCTAKVQAYPQTRKIGM